MYGSINVEYKCFKFPNFLATTDIYDVKENKMISISLAVYRNGVMALTALH